jgi:hypothetical protein
MLKKNHNLTKDKKENPNSLIDFYLPTITQAQGKINFKISSNIFKDLSQTEKGIEKIITFGNQCYESYLNTVYDKSIKMFLPSGLEEIFLYLLENNDVELHHKLKESGFLDKINQNLKITQEGLRSSSSPVKAVLINKKLLPIHLNENNVEIYQDWIKFYAQNETKSYSIMLEQQISQNNINLDLLFNVNKYFFSDSEKLTEIIDNLFMSLFNTKNNNSSEKDIKKIYDFILLNFKENNELLRFNYSHICLSLSINEKDKNLVDFLFQTLSPEKKLSLLNKITHEIDSHHEYNMLKSTDINLYDKIIENILIDSNTCHSIKKLLVENKYFNDFPNSYAKLEVEILNHALNKNVEKNNIKHKI